MRSLALSLVAAIGCGSSPTPAPRAAPPAAQPAAAATPRPNPAIEQALQREATTPLARQTVAIASLSFRGALLGLEPPRYEPDQGGDGTVQVRVPIGGEEPLVCGVYRNRIDLANTIRHSQERLKSSFRQTEIRRLEPGFEGDTPLVDLELLYLAESPQGNLVGMFKVRVANVGDNGIVCAHDEPGFVRTFDRATRALLAAAATTPRPDRFLIYVGDRAVGLMTMAVAETPQGGRSESTFVMVLPRSPTDLAATDSIERSQWNARGELIESAEIHGQNDEVSRYVVRRQRDRLEYHAEGRHMGRDFEGTFQTAQPLFANEASQRLATRALVAASNPTPRSYLHYAARSNPLGSKEVVYSLRESVGTDRAWLDLHEPDFDVRILARRTGEMEQGEMSVGGLPIRIQRFSE